METSRHTGRNRPGQAGLEGTCRKNRSGWAQQETSGPAARATGPQGRSRPYGPAVRNASGRHGPTGQRSKAAKRTPACGPMEPRRPQQGPGTQAGGRGAIQRAALPCRNDGNVTNRPQRRGTSEGRTTKGTPATAAKRARASEAPAGDEPAAGHRRGLAAPARNMPEKPKRSTGQAKRQERAAVKARRAAAEGLPPRGGAEALHCRKRAVCPEACRRAKATACECAPKGGGCKTSTRTTNPARSAKDATEQTSATRPKAKRSGSGRPEKPEKRTAAKPDCERRPFRRKTHEPQPPGPACRRAQRSGPDGTNGGGSEKFAGKPKRTTGQAEQRERPRSCRRPKPAEAHGIGEPAGPPRGTPREA